MAKEGQLTKSLELFAPMAAIPWLPSILSSKCIEKASSKKMEKMVRNQTLMCGIDH